LTLEIVDRLAIPGIIDIHSHFMPDAVMAKVWDYFDNAEKAYGVAWPIEYRFAQDERLAQLRSFGVLAYTSLVYAHKPEMAAWLNDWSLDFAESHQGAIPTATFYPDEDAAQYTASAIDRGAQIFKVHLQVGAFDPRDSRLVPVWDLLARHSIPVVVHCGSGPIPGEFTGVEPISEVITARPELAVIVAHMGAPEYSGFLDLAEQFPNVRLDTTMAFTDFMNSLAAFPLSELGRLHDAGMRGDVLFGSDFPNIPYPYAEAVTALERLGLGDEWMRAVLFSNANELFRRI